MIHRHWWGLGVAALAATLALAYLLQLAPPPRTQQTASPDEPLGEAHGRRTAEPREEVYPETPPKGEYEHVELVVDEEGNLVQGRLYADGTFVPAPTQYPRRMRDVMHRMGRIVNRREVRRIYRGPLDGEAPPVADTTPAAKPGRYLLLLTMDQGLLGVLDEQRVFRGEQLYSIGTAYSGAPVLKRRHVKEIIWPDGVDPAKYPAKKE